MGVPQCRRIAGTVCARHPLPDAGAWEAAVLDPWRRAAHREERYAAVELLLFRRNSKWLEPARLPMIEEMVVIGAHRDFAQRAPARPAIAGAGDFRVARPVERIWQASDPLLVRRATARLNASF